MSESLVFLSESLIFSQKTSDSLRKPINEFQALQFLLTFQLNGYSVRKTVHKLYIKCCLFSLVKCGHRGQIRIVYTILQSVRDKIVMPRHRSMKAACRLFLCVHSDFFTSLYSILSMEQSFWFKDLKTLKKLQRNIFL